jgi:hypothetical protein
MWDPHWASGIVRSRVRKSQNRLQT